MYIVNNKQNVEADKSVAAPVIGKTRKAIPVKNISDSKWCPKIKGFILLGNFSTSITIAKKDIVPIIKPVSSIN